MTINKTLGQDIGKGAAAAAFYVTIQKEDSKEIARKKMINLFTKILDRLLKKERGGKEE